MCARLTGPCTDPGAPKGDVWEGIGTGAGKELAIDMLFLVNTQDLGKHMSFELPADGWWNTKSCTGSKLGVGQTSCAMLGILVAQPFLLVSLLSSQTTVARFHCTARPDGQP